MHFRTILLCAILLVSGLTTNCENQDPDRIFICQIGKQYHVSKTLDFTIESIQDYRCPNGAWCIWAGDVDVYLKIEQPSQVTDTAMRMCDNGKNPLFIAGFTWEVLEVSPYPDVNTPSEAVEQRVRMRITEH